STDSDCVLYEIEAPAGYPDNYRLGPKIRQNLNRIREQSMSLEEYQHYCKCRQTSFISRQNRSRFLSWISLQRTDIAPDSVERVIAFLGLIAHDHIGDRQ
ncbi:hypothetical protein BVRB_031210, partial [Beta vulgaris subsp. vulgaris]